jgi:putative ABC transport system permease protein
VIVSETLADDLGAAAGDLLAVFYNNQPIPLRVVAVAVDSPLSGRFDPTTPGMTITLERLQELTGQQGLITLVAVSNQGGVRDGIELTDQVEARLKDAFAGMDLGVDPIKRASIDMAQLFSNIFTGLFLVLGLFSIAVGILLIILIFTMLAAERRSEMGMTRAIGGQRAQLIQQFVSEGTGYAILSGLVGAALGVLATVLIAWAFGALFGDFFAIEAHVTPRSLIVAYCLGVVITFIAVVGSSWRISRLNVVAAIRDIPEVTSPKRQRRTLVYAGLMILVGLFFVALGQGGEVARAFFFYGGMSLWPFGVALLGRYFGAPARPLFSAVGIYILVFWLIPPGTSEDLFGDLGGGFEMFFASGIFMVAGATILIVNNLDVLLWLLNVAGGLFGAKLTAVRTAISYPSAARGRTGMTVAMFSLIVFSLVTFATINENFVNLFLGDEANAGWDVRADLVSDNPIGEGTADDFNQTLAQAGAVGDLDPEEAALVAPEQFTATGVVTTTFQGQLRQPGQTEWRYYPVNGMDDGFLAESELFFQQRAAGYDSDAAVLEALASRDDVAVIDSFALYAPGAFGTDPNQFVLDDPDGEGPLEGLESGMDDFEPRVVEIEGSDGRVYSLTIIGIIDGKIGSLFGLFARQSAIAPIYPEPGVTSYYLKSAIPDQAEEQAKAIETALLENGLQAVSIRDELEEFQRQNRGFLLIIQGFMGLGLVVGVAAVGVIAFRAVVERRQQIGMLRALGYQRSLVALSFLIETTFVVGIGVLAGMGLAIPLAYNLMTSDDFAGSDVDFVVPWGLVLSILAITVLAALLMTWVPSRQAARLAPAEALRYE